MSRGSRERETTAYVLMGVATSPRRRCKLLKAGVKPENIPANSVLTVLDGQCNKFMRKHGDILDTKKHRRARFCTPEGVPFNHTHVPQT